jgi:hypothetical protein
MNFTASSVLNVRANSRASSITTAEGVSESVISSLTAKRRMSRSTTGKVGDGAARQSRRKTAEVVGWRPFVRPLSRKKRFDGSFDVDLADLPLVEDL